LGADKLRIICGPTAAGKSTIALQLCDLMGGAIVSADSRQIYCSFDIGTAKPSLEDCARITHYGVDVAEPEERYSAARWAADAAVWIESAGEVDRNPAIVGGTGLYIRALTRPLFDSPELDPERRADLARELENKSVNELRRICGVLDPARSHLGKTQLLRAIETALLAGVRISELHGAHNAQSSGDVPNATYLVVDPGDSLQKRIAARVDEMLGAGWAEEVRELIERVAPDAPAWKASGYRTMRDHVEGRLDLSSTRERVIIETRQYAKRQRTWFRHQVDQGDVTQLNPDDSRALAIAREWWEKAE
jgi:tRNA dimethylallyltransferase